MADERKGRVEGGPRNSGGDSDTKNKSRVNDARIDKGKATKELLALGVRMRARFPAALLKQQRWLCWKLEEKEDDPGHYTKMPYYATGRKRHGVQGSQPDLDSLVDFETALAAASKLGMTGVGKAQIEGDDNNGIDLDHIYDADGNLKTAARAILAFGTYTELSQSGQGAHMWFDGPPLPRDRCEDIGDGVGLETFSSVAHAGYLTCTGLPMEGYSQPYRAIDPVSRERLEALLEQYGERANSGTSRTNGAEHSKRFQRIAKHRRDTTLTSWAGKMRAAGFAEDTILTTMLQVNEQYCDPPIGESQVKKIVKSIAKYDPNSEARTELQYRRMSDIVPRPVKWLWLFRVALGKLTLFFGEPDVGKSHVLLDLAATVSTGGRFPDKTPCEQGKVIILSAEDGAEDTIRTRLGALGANMENIILLESVCAFDKDGKPTRRGFSISQDIERLGELLGVETGVKLIIIDPMNAYLGKVDTHRDADVRAVLEPLSKMTEKHGVAVIGLTHSNKDDKKKAILRLTGSIAFMAAARACYLICRDPDDDDKRLFLRVKNNLSSKVTGLSFIIESHQIMGPDNQPIQTSRCFWDAEAVETSADDALHANSKDNVSKAVFEAMKFIEDELRDGPQPAHQMFDRAKENGHSEITVRRANRKLGVIAEKNGGDKGTWWMWRLPGIKDPL